MDFQESSRNFAMFPQTFLGKLEVAGFWGVEESSVLQFF